ncbi:ferredoxin [Desulfitobacterium sp. LBE]|uniref:Ferredoxin n=4 Tax=root TaxID=1 RepID=A0A098AZD2_DESHA|nr:MULTISPECIES: ferredoxin [Desulfitobacterium]ACL20593.1 4Fe-4S ferredoxin iron-sulfur binding domain protein [Desulfitobacterium hafniense DCB-2]EHL08696.1 putative ferredoxin [Desulfitobacterium hafniense DP7]MEA5025348.1 ferredoxin [Desulfitobacterium hafniense]TWH56579.1 ferredoxin [Desulfitobacterium sp. LBE]CDX01475.1 3Fe-4S ferredoxin signature [Desulfitobacterium hafniense]
MYATVESDCIGCGSCEAVCPEIFRMNDDGLAEAYVNPVPAELEESAKEAADMCPVNVIILE